MSSSNLNGRSSAAAGGGGGGGGNSSSSRPTSRDGAQKKNANNIWSSMLDSVANGKRLPEKNLLILGMFRLNRQAPTASEHATCLALVLFSVFRFSVCYCKVEANENVRRSTLIGGTPESQREFLDTLSADTSDPNVPGTTNERRRGKTPPIANQFALGYTYQDVLDADQEGRWFALMPFASACVSICDQR